MGVSLNKFLKEFRLPLILVTSLQVTIFIFNKLKYFLVISCVRVELKTIVVKTSCVLFLEYTM
jgi:hypothetical protein